MSTQSTDYRSIKAISNSLMGVYEDDFDSFVRYWVYDQSLPQKKDDSLSLGSAIDTLLTRPDEFNDIFIVYNATAPTGQMQSFCYALANAYVEGQTAMPYQLAYDAVGFKRDTLIKVIEKFEPFKQYYQFLVDSKDKAVLTADQASRAQQIVSELKDSKYTRGPVNAQAHPGVLDVYNQLELVSTIRIGGQTLALKGALDRVIVDHLEKKIIPFDFKSSFNSDNFEYSYVKYRYYRQGSYYSYLLQKWAEEQGIGDYKMMKFTFIVCSTNRGRHYMYQMTEADLQAAREGGMIQYGYKIKGWRQILEEIAWLQERNNWEYAYEAQLHNGVIPLNVFKNESKHIEVIPLTRDSTGREG
jgi:hypothetical protein